MKISLERLALSLFFLSAILLAVGYGIISERYKIFPHTFIEEASQAIESLSSEVEGELPWYYVKLSDTEIPNTYKKGLAYEGLNLIVSIIKDGQLSVRVTDMEGQNIHAWKIDWFDIWSNPEHIPKDERPKSRPGTHIHGAALLENGDLVFNFEHLGLVRLNLCGDVVWRLPYRTHHSIYIDENGNLWVPGQRNHYQPLPGFPNYKPPFTEYTVLEVSPEGEIIQEISVMGLLKENDLNGLLYMSSLDNNSTQVMGDTLHLNDVEVFPSSMKPGAFSAGDIMISLRNISTILVFSQPDKKIKFLSTGGFVRQHDPDFIDGNTISVFDNNNVGPHGGGQQSRILILSAIKNKSFVYYTGNKEHPFYTDIMGKHQWLPNGNLLITAATKGRAFEVNKEGKIVWEFYNEIEPGIVGLMEGVQRLPLKYASLFSNEYTRNCIH